MLFQKERPVGLRDVIGSGKTEQARGAINFLTPALELDKGSDWRFVQHQLDRSQSRQLERAAKFLVAKAGPQAQRSQNLRQTLGIENVQLVLLTNLVAQIGRASCRERG